jgi:alpha-glutamyl/putrescinyl thymine pyrophosphorylase clade 1
MRFMAPVALNIVHRKAPTPSPVFDTYWRFAALRQDIFHRRVRGETGPWTTDPVLSVHRFTNAYRASDRVSQYLIRNVAYAGNDDPQDIVFRILLFKLFNRIETWELLEEAFGPLTVATFDVEAMDDILSRAFDSGQRIYSAAYIMPSAVPGHPRKHRSHLELLRMIIDSKLPSDIGDSRSMKEAYHLLLACPGLGPFLAYQLITDLNYSNMLDFSEMDFVVPGPGARSGLRKCFVDFGNYDEAELIRYVAERQDIEFERLGLSFETLWGRPLQLIDCQNLFCEVDKYARVMHPEVEGVGTRSRIKQKFKPATEAIDVWFPPKWGINENLPKANAS